MALVTDLQQNLEQQKLLRKARIWILLFIVGLILSGLTAFPIETLLSMVVAHINWAPNFTHEWILQVYSAVQVTNASYPFLSYGTDWLAFAHIVIGIAFIGPYKDPVRNIWVIQFGIINCALVIPLALIAGPIRGIPFYWQLIDCSFGVFGLIPLGICYSTIKKLERLQKTNQLSKDEHA